MLTGQFHELSGLIGSGVPVKIYKLDNNQTSRVVQVDQFTDPQDIPYPWEGDSWESAFVGYSISREQMKAPGVITGPTILYCFYDAEVSITFKLPLPEAKAVTISYGRGQMPQLRDITGSNQLVKQAAINRGVSFSLSDGTPIDQMRKPVEDTNVEVVLCNKETEVVIDSYPIFDNTRVLFTTSDNNVVSGTITIVDGQIPVHSVSYRMPRLPLVVPSSYATSSAGTVPFTIRTGVQTVNIGPAVSPMTAKGYAEQYTGETVNCRIIEFPEGNFGKVGASTGNTTTSIPTTFPTVPSLSDKQSWAEPNGDKHYGALISGSLGRGKYLPITLNAELKQFQTTFVAVIGADEIIMSRAPRLQNGGVAENTLSAWLGSNGSIHPDDQGVALWWRDNYQKMFLSEN